MTSTSFPPRPFQKGRKQLTPAARYFRPWFAKIDAAIIIGSFLIDTLTRGIAEEIGSLIVILRLWRFVKIAEEFSLGASEQMETLQARIETLEQENSTLNLRVRELASGHRDVEAAVGDS